MRKDLPNGHSDQHKNASIFAGNIEHDLPIGVAIRRYFDVSLYLLILTGFGTLASTGRLDLPTVVLVSAALLYRGYGLSRRWGRVLSERWTNLLTLACVGFFVADEFLISRTFLNASVHLVLFVMLVRLFSAQRDRDHYLLAVLSFLMVLSAAVLTVDSTFLLALAGFVLVAVATFILMEMAHSSARSPVQASDPQDPRAYRKLSFTIASIAPVLLAFIFLGAALIFFFLPRVSAGYLSAYTSANDLSTGFSDHVELGRIGQIQQSNAVVMHVRIDGDTNGATELKMRGVSLDSFDGKSWSNTHGKYPLKRGADGRFTLHWRNPAAPSGRPVHYRVTLEPVVSEVFFLLSTPASVEGNYRILAQDGAGDVFDADTGHPIATYEADSLLRVAARSNSQAPEAQLPQNYLQLPTLDPRVPKLAVQITANASTSLEKAQRLENYLRAQYAYTLDLPQTPPQDPIANFLFVRRRGHCEYFASAMAIMLRSLKIPSRVVNGFSGGDFNDVNSQYVVRASNAHSWVEAYIPGQGWLEFDPTPPGAGQAHSSWARLMMYVDALSAFWREWVVNYDFAHQFQLSQDAGRGSRAMVAQAQSWGRTQYNRLLDWAHKTQDKLGESTVKWGERALALFLIGLVIAAVPRIMAWVRRLRLARRPRSSPQAAASIWYERMLRQTARRGWSKSAAQTPDEFTASIGEPQLKNKVLVFTEHYEKARFGKSPEEASRLPELYQEIKAIR